MHYLTMRHFYTLAATRCLILDDRCMNNKDIVHKCRCLVVCIRNSQGRSFKLRKY